MIIVIVSGHGKAALVRVVVVLMLLMLLVVILPGCQEVVLGEVWCGGGCERCCGGGEVEDDFADEAGIVRAYRGVERGGIRGFEANRACTVTC